MGTLPKFFRTTGEGNLATFDFYDLATGTGYVTLYGLTVGDSATATASYALTTNEMFSANPVTTSAGAMEIYFDLAVDATITVDGDAIINIPFHVEGGADTVNVNIRFYRRRNGVNSQIGSTVTTAVEMPTNGTVPLCDIYPIPRTVFKPNDTLKLRINSDAVTTLSYLHSPKNRTDLSAYSITGTPISSQFIVKLPIRIQQ